MFKTILKVFIFILAMAYPFLIFVFLKKGIEPRMFSALLIIIILSQLKNIKLTRLKYVLAFVWSSMIIILFISNNSLILKLYPIVMGVAFFSVFALSLKYPPTMIEQFARLNEKELSKRAITYCRKVTIIWCVFFLINIAISFATLFMSLEAWTLYNGLISYLLMGTLFTGEFLYRIYYKRVNKA